MYTINLNPTMIQGFCFEIVSRWGFFWDGWGGFCLPSFFCIGVLPLIYGILVPSFPPPLVLGSVFVYISTPLFDVVVLASCQVRNISSFNSKNEAHHDVPCSECGAFFVQRGISHH
jgi:hypothetical protein